MSEVEQVQQAIQALEAQRSILGDAVVETALVPLREKLAALSVQPQEVEQQRKLVTVLFADVSGYTAYSETKDAEVVSDTMNALWARLDTAIEDHGGFIDKHMGDAVMALWSVEETLETDPIQTVRAALEMQARLDTFRNERQIELRMRIGINTGPALLGRIGLSGEFNAVGDAVNLASRLEHAAPVDGILISHNTYNQVRGVFDVQPLEPISVKGKTEPIQVYVVLKEKTGSAGTQRGIEGVQTRMVGRELELKTLRDAFLLAREDRETQVVTVIGDAGVGKSRLRHEFEVWLDDQDTDIEVFQGRATQQTAGLPYWVLRDLFAHCFGILDSDQRAVAWEKLERGFVELVGPAGKDKARYVGHLIGLEARDDARRDDVLDDAREMRDLAFQHLVELFMAVGASKPIVILLEDIHWADDASLDWVDHLAREGRDVPMVIVALSRPTLFERRAQWGVELPCHAPLMLEPLSKLDSRRLVAEVLQNCDDASDHLRDIIVDSAVGNPLYLEELIRMFIERGAIVKEAECWRVHEQNLDKVQVPPTVFGILQARLFSLPEDERMTLQRASVVGRVFWDGPLERLRADTGLLNQRGAAQILDDLRGRELIFTHEPSTFAGEDEYIFKHAVLHDVTYESVLIRRRKIYHAQVAAWLRERSGERADEYAGLIGEHYERADEMALAADWYIRAGKQAQDTFAPITAIDYYTKALAFEAEDATSTAQQIVGYEGLGEMLRSQLRLTEAAAAYDAMLAVAETVEDRVAQARAWEGLTWVQDEQGDYRAVLASAAKAEELARAAGPAGILVRAKALYRKGWGNFRVGDSQMALTLGQQALELSREANAHQVMGWSLNLVGLAHYLLGEQERAVRYLEEALALYQEVGYQAGIGGQLNNLAQIAQERGHHRKAVGYLQEALTIAREQGNRDWEMLYLSGLCASRIELGEHQAAASDLRRLIGMAESAGSGLLAEICYLLAKACLAQNKFTEAQEAAQRSLGVAQETGAPEWQGKAWRALGIATAQTGDPVNVSGTTYDPAACFAASLRIFREMGAENEQIQTMAAWHDYDPTQTAPPRAD